MRTRRLRSIPAVVVMMSALAWVHASAGCSSRTDGEATSVPAEFQQGEGKFKTSCARCHGERAGGTDHGPPLVHKIYEPSHHGDAAFQVAAARGVRAHHWSFGDMPKVEGVNSEDVTQITAYIRWLQRQAGIQ